MLLHGPARHTPAVFRLRASQTADYYGDPAEDWSAPTRTHLPVLDVQEVSSDESQTARVRVVENTRRLLLRGRADLLSTDRVEMLGKVWTVEGEPLIRTGLASEPFTSARLVLLTGGEGAQ